MINQYIGKLNFTTCLDIYTFRYYNRPHSSCNSRSYNSQQHTRNNTTTVGHTLRHSGQCNMRTTHVYTSTHTRRWKLIHRGRYDTFERPHEAWEPQCVYITSPHDDLTRYHTSCTRETAKHVLVTTMICAIMATTFASATMVIHKIWCTQCWIHFLGTSNQSIRPYGSCARNPHCPLP